MAQGTHFDGIIVGTGPIAHDDSVNGLRIGSAGTEINRVTKGTVSIDPGSIGTVARGAIAVTIAGVAIGDVVVMIPPASLNDDLLFVGARVTAVDTVTVYLYNPTAAAIDDVAAIWDYLWFDIGT
jgi:hypothetical protein